MRLALVALGLAACLPPTAPPAAPSAPSLPFTGVTAMMVHDASTRAPFEVDLAVNLTSSLTPADGLEVVVLDGDRAVARAPIAAELQHNCCGEDDTAADVPATVTLPALGDYRVEARYHGKAYRALAFRIVAVPCWGGVTQAQLLVDPGSHVSLARRTLSLARWRVEDAPTQAYRVEWRRDGASVVTDQGRNQPHGIYHARAAVMEAAPPRNPRELGRVLSPWHFGGEEYRVPQQVVDTPGRWTARVLREGAAPIEVAFTVAAGGALADVDPDDARISAPLALTPAPADEIAGWEASLTALPGKQEPDEGLLGQYTTAPIMMTAAATRALFRSQEVYRTWREFLAANDPTPEGVTVHTRGDREESPDEEYRRFKRADAEAEREGKGDNARKRQRAPKLRAQVLRLIQQYGGPWRPDEVPQ